MTDLKIGYFIITACKNEEKNISKLLECVIKQTIKPNLWVIVDESIDNTSDILKGAATRYNWIKCIFLDEKEDSYLGLNYTRACEIGFNFAIEYCKHNKIDYKYIGLVDADVIMDEDHFEKLISKFENNSKLGVASGIEYCNHAGKLIRNTQREELPVGPARLWRRECFIESGTGGYYASNGPPDTISNIKAKIRGWGTKQFEDISVVTRQTSTARGFWKGYFQKGKYAYVMYTPLFIVLIKSIKYGFNYPFYIGLAYIFGYFNGLIHRIKKIDDEIMTYMKNDKKRELFKYYSNNLRVQHK